MGSSLSDDLKAPAIGVIVDVTGCTVRNDGAGFDLKVKHRRTIGSAPSLPPFDAIFAFDEVAVGKQVLLIGSLTPSESNDSANRESWIWNAPIELSQAAVDYVAELPSESASETERLCYFYKHLFSNDLYVSDDAYCECARMSLASMRDEAFRNIVDKTQLAQALREEKLPARYKSFLWMVLSEVGSKEDTALFHSLVLPLIKQDLELADRESNETVARQSYPWLAAAIACYAKIEGDLGLAFLDKNILSNKSCSIGLKAATISAVRVLGAEMEAFASQRTAQSLALTLDDTSCADLVIPDLARWEYWDAFPELVKLFHDPQSEEGMVRHLIVNYVRHCPLEEAPGELSRMKQVDPQAYRHAVAMVPTVETGTSIRR